MRSDKKPHLVTEAITAIQKANRETGYKMPPPAVALLLILCDRVHASHGQWYGSWEKLATEYPWSRRWFNKWRVELEDAGFIKNLGPGPGRKLNTWQLLPWRYPLVGTDGDTSALVGTDVHTSSELVESPPVGTPVPGDPEQPFNPLVGTNASPLVGTDGDTNTRTPIEHQLEHPPYGGSSFAVAESVVQSFNEETIEEKEARRAKLKADFAAIAKRDAS